MDAVTLYQPGKRASQAQMNARRTALLELVAELQPATVRGIFYAATTRGLMPKIEAAYHRVGKCLGDLRRDGLLPYDWIVDLTRRVNEPATFSDIADALRTIRQVYRKNPWDHSPVHVQVWLEKAALEGVIQPVTHQYAVPLIVSRGYASLSVLNEAAELLKGINRPTHVYHIGDFDPSGVNAGETIERSLREMAPGAEIHFERLAVTPEQIRRWNLPTRPTKKSDTRAKNFESAISVEADAIAPPTLREITERAILRHLPADRLAAFKIDERADQERFAAMIRKLERGMTHADKTRKLSSVPRRESLLQGVEGHCGAHQQAGRKCVRMVRCRQWTATPGHWIPRHADDFAP
jgi:hypothetical protein